MQDVKQAIQTVVEDYNGTEVEPEISTPEEQFGDVTTNVALKMAASSGKSPREVAEELIAPLKKALKGTVDKIEIAGPGFINFFLSDDALWQELKCLPELAYKGKVAVAEYSDPNPFKTLHAGHLYTSLVGDAVAKLLEKGGAKVHRVNFGGDVGRHVAMAMWSILKELDGENFERLNQLENDDKLGWISARYVEGTTAYETDTAAKRQIDELNKKIYEIHTKNDQNSQLAKIYWQCRQWSYEGFDALYKRLGMVPFEKYYPESQVADLGLEKVRGQVDKVYEESDGAVVFRGESHGLFTQVFITSNGLPTYAAKDVGLIFHKNQDFKPDISFIFTDISQKDQLRVVMKSIEQFAPELVAATVHYTHGRIKLAGGIKMSSRKGNFLRATDILDVAAKAAKTLGRQPDETLTLAAVKYAFLKTRIDGSDIIYDPLESVSLEGNSGPYLQYAHARARSVLAKDKPHSPSVSMETDRLEQAERSLLRKMSQYQTTVNRAVADLMPHYICTYLYELSQVFNRFYENNRVIGNKREALRLALVKEYADILKEGLALLNIEAADRI